MQKIKAGVPGFIREGLGVCARSDTMDDFTNDSRKLAGYVARERARRECKDVCPFAAECLPWAIESEQTGVFGGEWMIEGKVRENARPTRAKVAA